MNRRRERKDMAFGSILPATGRKITVHLGGTCVSGVNGVFFGLVKLLVGLFQSLLRGQRGGIQQLSGVNRGR